MQQMQGNSKMKPPVQLADLKFLWFENAPNIEKVGTTHNNSLKEAQILVLEN